MHLFDTVSGQERATGGPDRPATLYVCGITPYDATHLGHATTYLTFDLLVRAWLDLGRDVRYVQNVTDVDDPLLERAAATGVDWRDLAEEQTDLFRSDMVQLRVIPPARYVGRWSRSRWWSTRSPISSRRATPTGCPPPRRPAPRRTVAWATSTRTSAATSSSPPGSTYATST